MDRGLWLHLGNRLASCPHVIEIDGEPVKGRRFVDTEALRTVRSHNRMDFVAPAQQCFRHVGPNETAGASYENLHLDYWLLLANVPVVRNLPIEGIDPFGEGEPDPPQHLLHAPRLRAHLTDLLLHRFGQERQVDRLRREQRSKS